MKEFRIKNVSILLLLLYLSACQISSGPSVSISPASKVLEPGESLDLRASSNLEGLVEFFWSASAGSLSATSGVRVRYTAPETPGSYIVTATSNLPSRAGVARITVAERVVAQSNPQKPIKTGQNLGIVREHVYKVIVPAGLQRPLLYFEVASKDSLELSLYDHRQIAIARSNSKQRFVEAGFSSLSLDTEAISSDLVCRGPCIIIRNEPGVYYLKVASAFIASYDLYVYGDSYQDTAEPDDAMCSSASLRIAAISITVTGAIETLDDKDCIAVNGASRIRVSSLATTAIRLRLKLYDDKGFLLDTQRLGPGSDSYTFMFSSSSNALLVISGDAEAGPAASSGYKVSVD